MTANNKFHVGQQWHLQKQIDHMQGLEYGHIGIQTITFEMTLTEIRVFDRTLNFSDGKCTENAVNCEVDDARGIWYNSIGQGFDVIQKLPNDILDKFTTEPKSKYWSTTSVKVFG